MNMIEMANQIKVLMVYCSQKESAISSAKPVLALKKNEVS